MIEKADLLAQSAPELQFEPLCDFLKEMDKTESALCRKEVSQINLEQAAKAPFVAAGTLLGTVIKIALFIVKCTCVIILLNPLTWPVGLLLGLYFLFGGSSNGNTPVKTTWEKQEEKWYLRLKAKIRLLDLQQATQANIQLSYAKEHFQRGIDKYELAHGLIRANGG